MLIIYLNQRIFAKMNRVHSVGARAFEHLTALFRIQNRHLLVSTNTLHITNNAIVWPGNAFRLVSNYMVAMPGVHPPVDSSVQVSEFGSERGVAWR